MGGLKVFLFVKGKASIGVIIFKMRDLEPKPGQKILLLYEDLNLLQYLSFLLLRDSNASLFQKSYDYADAASWHGTEN